MSVQESMKRAVYSAWQDAGISKSELARRMGCDEQEVRRILNPSYQTKLPNLESAARALGYRLALIFEPEAGSQQGCAQ